MFKDKLSKPAGAGGAGGGGAGGGGARDIEQMFKEKVKIAQPIKPNRASPLFGVLKV
jgi:hypothetical protein